MQGQEAEFDGALKLPALMSRKSKSEPTKDAALETPNGLHATSKAETLPNIFLSDKSNVKRVTFEDGIQYVEANQEQDLRLPNIHETASSTSLEDKRFDENCQTDKNDLTSLENGRETESHFSKKDNAIGDKESFPQMMKNYEYQRDLRYTQCSQKLSRKKYSYFPRFPSPKPLNKREKLKKEMEEKASKKREEVIHPGSLRTKEEYSKIFLSLRKVEKQFVKKHKLSCRPMDSPFFLD
ncbi:uncharacterized protein LOC144655265 [Oculina patagonica]